MDTVKKAWILDTDIGWDPDDIIALLCLIQYIKKSNDKLAIISSNETIENNRAYLIKDVVDELIPNNNIIVAHGVKNIESIMTNNHIIPLFSSYLKYHKNSKKNISNIDNIIEFINESKKNNYHVTWLGIGSMTNIAYLLKKNIKPDHIIQMGGTIYDEVEFNIKLDIVSCKYVLENWNNSNTLEFITLDTTGYNLEWIKSSEEKLYDRLHDNFKNILLEKYPYILETIINNINFNENNIGYNGSSSLHDPLTIMYAIDHSILKTYNSKILCNINGKWNAKIKKNTLINLKNNNRYFKMWYDNIKDNVVIINNIELSVKQEQIIKENLLPENFLNNINEYNCKISIGPLNDDQINNFIDKLFILLNEK